MDNNNNIVEQSINLIKEPTFAVDLNHKVILWNKSCEEFTGILAKEMIGTRNHWQIIYNYPRPCLLDLVVDGDENELIKLYGKETLKVNGVYGYEGWFFNRKKELKFLYVEAKIIYDSNNKPIGAVECVNDLTEKTIMNEKLKFSYSVFDKVAVGVIITDQAKNIIFINKHMEKISGFFLEDVIGKNHSYIFLDYSDSEKMEQILNSLKENGSWHGELVGLTKDGKEYKAKVNSSKLTMDQRETHYVSLISNITEQKKTIEKLKFLANYDYLTKLPNRAFLEQKIKQCINDCEEKNQKCAVMFLDLDKFKNVNDSLGHDVGDVLLKEVAKRLKDKVGDNGIVARQGGDEFVILLENIKNIDSVKLIAKNIKNSFSRSFNVKKHKISVTASIGISIYPENGITVNDLLKNADTSMYSSKDKRSGEVSIYEEKMNQHIIENILIIDKLNRVIDSDLIIYFQPQYCLKTKKLFGAESLIRWYDEDLGWIPPAKFIPIAEEFGLIKKIGSFVLNETCKMIKDSNLKISVNLSPIQLADEDIVKDIEKAIKKYKINPSLLTLEITEGAFISNYNDAKKVLLNLKNLGVQIALDDFGTGYASLSYLNQLPLDYLKIDQSFIKDPNNMSIVISIIDMAERLNLKTIAEGVETVDQLIMLKYSGCSFIQGYYYSRPIKKEDFLDFIKKDNSQKVESVYDYALIDLKEFGVGILDEDHKLLLIELEKIEEGISNKKAREELINSLNGLYNKFLNHFFEEEGLMVDFEYKKYNHHKTEHNKMLEKYLLYLNDIIADKKPILPFLSFVRRWLIGHIMIEDRDFIEEHLLKGLDV
jgi:diguanylate cyclase (GGDEF)-like protein/PAS domain S-box-containing protein/hemerythrin-like metal-binding protein